MPLVAVELVELIDQVVVLLDEFFDVLDELVLILCDIDLRGRTDRGCLLERVGDTVHLQLVFLEVRVVASVDRDVCVRPRSRH